MSGARRVLIISPHFPPDASAAAHRARLLAPHLPAAGWQPTVIAVAAEDTGETLDPELGAAVPDDLDVRRCRAWSRTAARRLGFGDLGLRAWRALRRAAVDAMTADPAAIVFITIYPTYPALLGPSLASRFGARFVLDLQDPWVGAWGATLGPGGTPDVRSRASRALALQLEPRVVARAAAVTAVSRGTIDELAARVPRVADRPREVLPIGWDPSDWQRLDARGLANGFFDPADGRLHLCWVGTLLPGGLDTMRGFLRALRQVVDRQPSLAERVRVWCVGTSNEARADAPARVRPLAEEAGIASVVHEHPARVPFFQALALARDAHAVLLFGSHEPHYTPSRAFAAAASGNHVLGAFHEASDVVSLLAALAPSRLVRIVTFAPGPTPETVTALAAHLEAILGAPRALRPAIEPAIEPYSAPRLAARLGGLFDRVMAGEGCR
ncbi:MAG: hypothetical protein AB7O67_03185 [Vicinamibacterales bacterium]